MKTYEFTINGKEYTVEIGAVESTSAQVVVNGQNYTVNYPEKKVSQPVAVAPVAAPVAAAPVSAAPAKPAPAAVPAGGSTIASPLPGVILQVLVKDGEAVKRGQKLLVLEAMKMENDILAEADGTVTKVLVQQGDSVLEGADLVVMA